MATQFSFGVSVREFLKHTSREQLFEHVIHACPVISIEAANLPFAAHGAFLVYDSNAP
jgi:hypothetical protein